MDGIQLAQEKQEIGHDAACDFCYGRKIGCDRKRPQCGSCKRHRLSCNFTAARRPTRKSAKQRNILDRLERLESALRRKRILDTQSKPTPTLPAAIQVRLAGPSWPLQDGLYLAGYRLGDICTYSGIPLWTPEGQKWVAAQTGEAAQMHRLLTSKFPWSKQTSTPRLTSNIPPLSADALPSKKLIEHYVQRYCSSKAYYCISILEPSLCQATIESAYESASGMRVSNIPSTAWVYAFIAYISRFPSLWPEVKDIDGDSYARMAESLLAELANSAATIPSLEAALMLTMYHGISGHSQTADIFLSISARLLFALGAHCVSAIPPSLRWSSVDTDGSLCQRHLRLLFWICYSMDKEMCIRTGKPPVLNDEHCDLTLPDNILDSYNGLANSDIPRYVGDIRLSIIKSHVFMSLYTVSAFQIPDAELLRRIRELDQELEQWRLSLPPNRRPSFQATPMSNLSPPVKVINANYLMFCFDYDHVVRSIHQASMRCQAWSATPQGVYSGLNSSMQLSLESCRRSLKLMTTLADLLIEDLFWITIMWPISAFLSLFCGILLNPHSPESKEDFKLLEETFQKATEFSANICPHSIPVQEHKQLMDEASIDVLRLAKRVAKLYNFFNEP